MKLTQKKTLSLQNLIEDEDIRQDVFLYILTGYTIDKAIETAILKNIVCLTMESNRALINSILKKNHPSYREMIDLPENDRVVALMALAGFDIELISKYNNVSVTYISNLIDTIGAKNGVKKEPNGS